MQVPLQLSPSLVQDPIRGHEDVETLGVATLALFLLEAQSRKLPVNNRCHVCHLRESRLYLLLRHPALLISMSDVALRLLERLLESLGLVNSGPELCFGHLLGANSAHHSLDV